MSIQEYGYVSSVAKDYRTLAKLYSTYIIGIEKAVKDDSHLHTIYTQTLTRTGRLSSIEPNLQNIPIRYEEGKLIRKAFIPEDDCEFISSDYSLITQKNISDMSVLLTVDVMYIDYNNNII